MIGCAAPGAYFDSGQGVHHCGVVAPTQYRPNRLQRERWVALADGPHRRLARLDKRALARAADEFIRCASENIRGVAQDGIDNVHCAPSPVPGHSALWGWR